ncbi:beta-phosphoglucomutase [Sporolactobacillus laevolacticus DSM 442]|uniref:Beta-phosphoglucomutase n=2 Tax=Sporolactobacillus laevolacticus TaxID=33018 RepID=V6J177_9BACL|nr:beta-phosphoglucomutase [Sporolactobacillus laevolacticus DSM 442]
MMQAVLFDLDGVITDTAKYHFQAWKRLASTLGISIDERFNERLKGVSRMDSLKRILEYGGLSNHHFTSIQLEQMAEQKNNDYKQLIQGITPKELLPGISELLTALRSKGIKIALASASKNGPFILERLKIDTFFDSVVDPAKLQKGKPDPEIFLTAAAQLGIDPKECAGIEDSVAGIESILAAGMFAVGVGVPENIGAHFRVASTTELTIDALFSHFKHR